MSAVEADVGSLAQVAERPVLVEGRHRERLAGRRRAAPRGRRGSRPCRPGRQRRPRARVVERGSRRTNGWSAATLGAHPLLDGREVVRGERARQVEVVVEAVRDRRPDPEPRAGEEVEDRLRHHVRRRVAHRVEGRVRARVEQLVRRAAGRRLEAGLVSSTAIASCSSSAMSSPPGTRNPLVHPGREGRGLPRFHPTSRRRRPGALWWPR